MKRICIIFLMTVVLSACSTKKQCIVSIDHNGKDASGNKVISMPITIKVYDAKTDALKTQAVINGPVSGFALPPFPIEVKGDRDTPNTFSFYATATDSARNVSKRSKVVTIVIVRDKAILLK